MCNQVPHLNSWLSSHATSLATTKDLRLGALLTAWTAALPGANAANVLAKKPLIKELAP